ncbi:MAG: VapE domain-containing protein, partial [Nostocales cyanobacterium 94392]|nr:VapE domain-containing protein [Nostocales cyanobacterium 94392]
VTVNRTCFFVGTTNKKDLLNDPTGDRRYWVLDVLTDFIPYKLLDSERDLIWAAALKLYRQGERWDLNEQEKTLSYGSNEEYHSQDPWEDAIARYINIHYKVTTQEILTDALKFEINQCDLLKQRRVVAILQRLGCESKTVSRNGKKFRAWVYTPPSPEGNADVTAYAVDVTPTVTAQIQSQQASELTVTSVTPICENFSENSEIQSSVPTGNLIETDVTGVTEGDNNSPNLCDESVLDGNAFVESEEEITVLPEVTALPSSESMSEEIAVLPEVTALPSSEWMSEEIAVLPEVTALPSSEWMSEEIAVLPEVTALPPSEWMSEENLEAIAADLEWCVSIEQFEVFMNIYNFEALAIAASRTGASKQEQIKLWIAQLDADTDEIYHEPENK